MVVGLQADNNSSMLVTLLSLTYDDFKLEQSDIPIYRNNGYADFSGFCESQSYHPEVWNLLWDAWHTRPGEVRSLAFREEISHNRIHMR